MIVLEKERWPYRAGMAVDGWCMPDCRYVGYVGVRLRARLLEVLQISEALTEWKVWGLFHKCCYQKRRTRIRKNKRVRKVHRTEVGAK